MQLDLAPAEIAFVFRQGLAHGAEVCRRGSHEWRPLVTTPELQRLLALRASSPELLESLMTRPPRQAPKSAPPPPPPLIEPTTVPTLAVPVPAPRMDSIPDWEDTLPRSRHVVAVSATPEPLHTPLTPAAIVEPAPARTQSEAPTSLAVESASVFARGHARPLELSLVAVAAVGITLAFSAFILRASAPNPRTLTTVVTLPAAHAENANAESSSSVSGAAPESAAPSGIPVVTVRDLPFEGGKASVSTRLASAVSAARYDPSSGPNRASLARALGGAAAAARNCGAGPVTAQVVVTYAPSGVARNIHFTSAPPIAMRSCVLNAVARAHVPPFVGDPVTVSKTLRW